MIGIDSILKVMPNHVNIIFQCPLRIHYSHLIGDSSNPEKLVLRKSSSGDGFYDQGKGGMKMYTRSMRDSLSNEKYFVVLYSAIKISSFFLFHPGQGFAFLFPFCVLSLPKTKENMATKDRTIPIKNKEPTSHPRSYKV